MRKRVTIRTPTASDDGRGGRTISWADTATGVPAEIDENNGREFLQAGVIQNALGRRIRMRYHSAIGIGKRLYVEPSGPILEIQEVVNPNALNRWHILAAIEVDK